jgi:hypothetical protein
VTLSRSERLETIQQEHDDRDKRNRSSLFSITAHELAQSIRACNIFIFVFFDGFQSSFFLNLFFKVL